MCGVSTRLKPIRRFISDWICIALEIQQHGWQVEGLSANQLHRLEGIVVYFGFLLLLFVLTEKRNGALSRRVVLFPLGIYYATTLGLPLLNGSYRQGSPFLEHSLFVLTLPLLLLATYAVIAFFVGAALRGRPRLESCSQNPKPSIL